MYDQRCLLIFDQIAERYVLSTYHAFYTARWFSSYNRMKEYLNGTLHDNNMRIHALNFTEYSLDFLLQTTNVDQTYSVVYDLVNATI